MADSILLVVGVWLAVQLPLALFIGAVIRRGRERDPVDRDANCDTWPTKAA